MDGPRPKRRCAQRPAHTLPSASHYVGYVEEDETPEMIMKKFEELDRVMQASARAGCHARQAAAHETHAICSDEMSHPRINDATGQYLADGLDEASLLEVFKRTR